uniref:Luciferase-like protein 4 n=1 Tax=Watasenia scintillans TaxID=6625 RepID=A0A346DKM2_WATSC|nr:luciferase-like protein 4 [Watasenia scintillans]
MKSYFNHPAKMELIHESIPERMQRLAEDDPDKTAIVMYHSIDERYELTRMELWDRCLRFGRAFYKLNLEKEARVAYCAPNSINWFAYDVGMMMTGAVPVHLHLGDYDIETVLDGCDVVVIELKEHWDDFLAIAEILPGGVVRCKSVPSLKLAVAVTAVDQPENALLLPEMVAEVDAQYPQTFKPFPYIDPEDIGFINLTSGTTGVPKRVRHSHFNVLNCPPVRSVHDEFTDDEVRFVNCDMSYLNGFPFDFLQLGSVFVCGDPAYLNDPKNFEKIVSIWKKEECTMLSVDPESVKNLKYSGFRTRMCVSSGEIMTKDMIHNTFCIADRMLMIYASTEAFRVSHQVFTKSNIGQYLPGMLGLPTQGVEVKIVNGMGGLMELGEPGILSVRSPWLSRGYDGASSSSLDYNFWLKTDDVASMMPAGDLLLKGRVSDFIIKSDCCIPSATIESNVDRHPDVKGVVVIGVPASDIDEDACACVQLVSGRKFDSASLRQYCKDYAQRDNENISGTKTIIPTYFLEFGEFPTIRGGKLDKLKMKQIAIERLDLEDRRK